MRRRAVCVGVNDYPQRGSDLRGCVNDARAWADVLVRHYDFAPADVTVLLDRDATAERVLGALDRMLDDARRGDVLAFCMSSHGTYLIDRSGDEADRYDEALCPHDVADHPIADDELRARFAALPGAVHLTVVADTCHSGSVTRAPAARLDGPPARARFLSPRAIGRPVADRPLRRPRPAPAGNEVLISGCRDDQYAFDAKFGRRYHGAMTHAALGILRDAGYRLTYRELRDRLAAAVRALGFDQDPQVVGHERNLDREVFR